ncbi:MAG: glycosyltransferase family 39 protein [Leptolyngbyaceae cyanobacterium T60_A2020_046]|nr:glycosyltransferase family 39 protein [Leptolyngbyaceae cyanobacterium T60_A2020_046]
MATLSKLASPRESSILWLAIALCFSLGIAFRLFRLDDKVLWHDEVYTLLRVTGHIGAAVQAAVMTGEPITGAELLKFQQFAPDATFGDTWRSLLDHPEHPPLYYLLLWIWVKGWGTSIAAFRSLSALFSIAAVPIMALLCRALYQSRRAALIGVALLALSPVQILYAQEAREYSLWGLLTLLASWLLVRAVRQPTPRAWLFYSVALALGLYTSVLAGLTLMAHAVYGAIALPKRRWLSLGLAIAGSSLLFVPWMLVIITRMGRLKTVTDWIYAVPPWGVRIKLWGLHFASVFVDMNLPLSHLYTYLVPAILVGLIGVAMVQMARSQPYRVGLLPISLVVIPAAVLMGGDIVRSTQISSHTRYFFPTLLGIVVLMAGWLSDRARHRPRQVVVGLTVLLCSGLISASLSATSPSWWNKGVSYQNAQIASAIATQPPPVVLMGQNRGTTVGDFISLAHRLPDTTLFQLTPLSETPPLVEQATTKLLFQPSEEFRNAYACPSEPLPELMPETVWLLRC